jgi:hypothetical protein
MKKYLIGYTLKRPFEDENGKEVYLNEFQEIAVLSSPFDEEKTLKRFIEINKDKLKEKGIKENKLLIEEYKEIGFNEMMNTFKGGGLK